MTENEAKRKWCPMVRLGQSNMNQPAINRQPDADVPSGARCIGMACMMWRQDQKPNPDWKPSSGMMSSYPYQDTRFDTPMYIADETSGHCGLAGRPP